MMFGMADHSVPEPNNHNLQVCITDLLIKLEFLKVQFGHGPHSQIKKLDFLLLQNLRGLKLHS